LTSMNQLLKSCAGKVDRHILTDSESLFYPFPWTQTVLR
jgi:hypothetical protein